MRDPKSYAYNPYAMGSTVDEAAEFFGMDGFDEKWLNRNLSILKSGNETAIKFYQQVYDAEQFTLQAEDETRKLSDRISARLSKAVSAGETLDANVLLKDALFGLDTLQSMDDGLKSGDLVKLTRPVHYRWQDVAGQVNDQAQIINARQNAPYIPADLELAARNGEEKVLRGQGTLIQKDAVPRSYTSYHESMPGLWTAGIAKNPLSAGWYVPVGGAQSGFGPGQANAQAIADSRRAGDLSGAAAQGYDVLTASGVDISMLSTNEGAVRMAADLALDAAKAYTPEQMAIPALQAAVTRYDAVVNNILGIDPDAVVQILPQIHYATTVQGDIKNQASGTAGLLSVLLRLDEGILKTVTDHVLGEAPSLQTVQTMFRVLKLRDMETGTKSKAFQAAEAALSRAAGNKLQTAAAQTGHAELDDLTIIAGKSSHNLDALLKRWGMQGVNYIGNLLQAGRGDLAAAITAMPTYAKSAIVAETNMRTFGLNDTAIAAQENALAEDMKSPIVVLSAKQIAKRQAVEARKAELNTGGALGVQSVLVQKVNDAGKNVSRSKPVLDQAIRNEQAGREVLTKAQALFHKNMADTAAADAVAAAIEQLQKAIDARVKAQKALTHNQQTQSDAQQKLDSAQKQATARVDEQAKQDVDVMRLSLAEARTKLIVQAGEQGNVQPDWPQPGNVSNKRDLLANDHDSGIMETRGSGGGSGSGSEEEKSATPGELLAAVMTPEQLAGLPSNKEIVFSMLTKEQKRRADDGENLFTIIQELDPGKQQQIEQMAQGIYESLSSQQRKDLIFLRSGAVLAGESLDTRMAILRWKKEHQKDITYEDLVKMGLYTQGELEDAGRDWASLINLEYDLVYNKDASIAMYDLEQRLQQGMEMTMLFAMAAAPIIDRVLYGPSDQIYANNAYDNIERQGTTGNFKGGKGYIPPTVEENPGGLAVGERSWYKADGSFNHPPNNGAVAGSEEIIELQKGARFGRYGGYTNNSDFVAESGSSADSLSLPPYTNTSIYQEFEVLKSIPGVTKSIVEPWGGSIGKGVQYKLPMTIEELIRQGYLRK